MKIAIITFHAGINYGAALQAFALQTHLLKYGHKVYFINYSLFGLIPNQSIRNWVGKTPLNTIKKINNELKKKPFIQFQNDFMNIGDQLYTDYLQLQNNPPVADVYISGSDQIWNPNYIWRNTDEHSYWIDFGPNYTRKIAYAASFGVAELDDKIRERYSGYAKKYYKIGVRERGGVQLMKMLGRDDAVFVPDPTLLIRSSEYESIEIIRSEKKNKYLFSYILGLNNEKTKLASHVKNVSCSILNIKPYEVFAGSIIHNILYRGYIGPREWLGYIRLSSFVVTNSFHATVFSLLFHKPFIVILNDGEPLGIHGRIVSLLNIVDLQSRIVNTYDFEKIKKLCKEEVDWVDVDKKIKEYSAIGVEFINKAML